jgi:hypothetical protein
MGDGKRSAAAIHSYLNGVYPPPDEEPAAEEHPHKAAVTA